MYSILGVRLSQKFQFFEDAFNHQQKNHPDKMIIYSEDNLVEIVWKPEWEHYSFEDDDVLKTDKET